MNGLKYILPIFLAISANSAEVIDSNKSLQRDGYMPEIVSPNSVKSGFYGGLGLGTGLNSFSSSTSKEDIKTADVAVIAGYNFNNYIAAESRASVSIANDSTVNYKKASIYLKPQYEVYSGVNLYSLLGFGNFSTKSVDSESTESSKASLQFGVGADYKLGKNFKLFADYTYLGKDDKAKYNSKAAILKSASVVTGLTYEF